MLELAHYLMGRDCSKNSMISELFRDGLAFGEGCSTMYD